MAPVSARVRAYEQASGFNVTKASSRRRKLVSAGALSVAWSGNLIRNLRHRDQTDREGKRQTQERHRSADCHTTSW